MKRRISPRKQAGGLLTASPFLLPSLIGMLIFSVLPLIISGMISLTDWNGLAKLTDPGFLQEHFIGLENYKKILTSTEFWRTLGNTAEYIFLYIPLMLAASLLVATLLSQARRGIGFFRVVYYIPVLTSWVAASLIWKSVLSPQYGALNGILSIFGIQGPGWLTDEKWAMPAIVLVSVWKDMGFFQLFPQIMIMTGGGPNGATQVMVERIYNYGFRYYRMGYASAFSWILFAIIMVFTAIQMKGQERWVHYDN